MEPQITDETADVIDFEQQIADALAEANDPESHVERDAETFHASQLAMCDRQCYTSKLGLKDDSEILGIFQTGTLIHEFLEDAFAPRHENEPVDFEWPVESTDLPTGITITGRADCVDRRNGIVYDFKTRNGWYNFDPPVQRHLDQLYCYMAALKGVDRGRIVYISKGDMDVREWPEDGTLAFDEERYDELLSKADRIRDAIEEHGIAESADDIPFDPCGCFICENETLRPDR
jgi:hypothetical protein